MASPKFDSMLINPHMELMDLVAFRGDDRNPKEIFEFGFQRLGSTLRFFNEHGIIEEPFFRGRDIKPTSAVCVTKHIDLSPLFPTGDPPNNLPPKTSWIYAVRIKFAYPTYKKQHELGLNLQFAVEIASRDIPSSDVLCAIQCDRFWNIDTEGKCSWQNGMRYQLVGIILWNPKNKNVTSVKMKAEKDYLIELINMRSNKIIECPIPDNEEKIASVLKGNYDYPIKQISLQEHLDRELLVRFVKDIMDQKITTSLSINYLKDCSNLDRLIPNLDLTPLMLAVLQENIVAMEYLFKAKVKIGVVDPSGYTAIDYANESNNQDVIKLIEDYTQFSEEKDKQSHGLRNTVSRI